MQGTRADLLANGAVVAATTIAAGALDGVPGIYSGAGTLGVVGLIVRTAAVVAPGAVR